MIRLTSYLNGSPIYVPADVVIKENYEYEFEMNHALPTSKYKQLGGSMVVYGGVEYSVKESLEEVARKVLEWRLAMEKSKMAFAEAMKRQADPLSIFENYVDELHRLAGLEEQG